jgi:hypothetical protein
MKLRSLTSTAVKNVTLMCVRTVAHRKILKTLSVCRQITTASSKLIARDTTVTSVAIQKSKACGLVIRMIANSIFVRAVWARWKLDVHIPIHLNLMWNSSNVVSVIACNTPAWFAKARTATLEFVLNVLWVTQRSRIKWVTPVKWTRKEKSKRSFATTVLSSNRAWYRVRVAI